MMESTRAISNGHAARFPECLSPSRAARPHPPKHESISTSAAHPSSLIHKIVDRADTLHGERIRKPAESAGTEAAHSAEAGAAASQSRRRHAAGISSWDPSSLPDWLNAETFTEKIRPLLANLTTSAIATALGVSWVYASHIRAGAKRPHPRHWAKLAVLGYSANQTPNARAGELARPSTTEQA